MDTYFLIFFDKYIYTMSDLSYIQLMYYTWVVMVSIIIFKIGLIIVLFLILSLIGAIFSKPVKRVWKDLVNKVTK